MLLPCADACTGSFFLRGPQTGHRATEKEESRSVPKGVRPRPTSLPILPSIATLVALQTNYLSTYYSLHYTSYAQHERNNGTAPRTTAPTRNNQQQLQTNNHRTPPTQDHHPEDTTNNYHHQTTNRRKNPSKEKTCRLPPTARPRASTTRCIGQSIYQLANQTTTNNTEANYYHHHHHRS